LECTKKEVLGSRKNEKNHATGTTGYAGQLYHVQKYGMDQTGHNGTDLR